MIFRREQLHATCCFVGCWVYLLAAWFRPKQSLALAAGPATSFLMQILAVRYKLILPDPENR